MIEQNTLTDFINRYQVDGLLWKADRLLADQSNPILRNDNVKQIATTLSLIPESELVLRDDYIKKIAKAHDLNTKTLEKFIEDAKLVERKKRVKENKKKGKKNVIPKLDGDPKVFKFFDEIIKTDKGGMPIGLDRIKIDKYKFTQLLQHFGFSRYETPSTGQSGQGGGEQYAFVQLAGNIIRSVTRDEIIDTVENFVKHEFDFEGAKYDFTDPLKLINTFYDQMRTIFSKDLFARVRTENPIIINTDTTESTFLYYKNGFVEATKDGWKLRNYEEMNGSVWEHQMLDRNFTKIDLPEIDWKGEEIHKHLGHFADFCWKLAQEKEDRFVALCTIIGYLMHDFYEYKLKAIMLTDSSISEASEGRTGKTLIMKMIGNMRSYCEINGKDFDSTSLAKYQSADLGTQVLHLNDVKHKGRFKFDFEDVFNDITEGYIVKKLYMPVFRQYSKMAISTNKTLNIQGASQRDRIVEFEVGTFFGEHRSPGSYYGHWFPERNGKRKDWDEAEFNRFDNFMCMCSQLFHKLGLVEPTAVNLGERKLMNHTSPDFLEFMDDIISNLKESGVPWHGYTESGGQTGFVASCELHDFEFEKGKMYDHILVQFPDFKKWLTQRIFNTWLKQFGEHRMHAAPVERKSNGKVYIKFIKGDKKL